MHANLIEGFWELTLALPRDNPWRNDLRSLCILSRMDVDEDVRFFGNLQTPTPRNPPTQCVRSRHGHTKMKAW